MKAVHYIVLVIIMIMHMQSYGQGLPELEKIEGRYFYSGMYNNFDIKLNGSDASQVSIKCTNGSIKNTNDSTYQIFLRSPQDGEVKIKLYYKNLPVDIMTLPVAATPQVIISLSEVKDAYKIADLERIKVEVRPEDPYFGGDEFELYSYKVTFGATNNPNSGFMNMRAPELSSLKSSMSKRPDVFSLFLSEFKLKNKHNQVINFSSEAFEIKLDRP